MTTTAFKFTLASIIPIVSYIMLIDYFIFWGYFLPVILCLSEMIMNINEINKGDYCRKLTYTVLMILTQVINIGIVLIFRKMPPHYGDQNMT